MLIWLLLCCAVWAELDPYQVLGLSRSATADQIKKAYKQKAVQFHPDKNPDPAANSKFVEINSAHEILSDPDKKRHYDRYGTSQEQPAHQSHPWSYQRRYMDYYTQSTYPDSVSVKLTYDTYQQRVTGHGSDPAQARVWLVFVFSDFGCQLCQKMAPVWEEAAKLLQDYVHTGKLNADFESSLINKLGIRTVPSIVAIKTIKGKSQVKLFYTNSWQLRSADPIVEFASQQLDPGALRIIQGKSLVDLRKAWQTFDETEKGLVHFLVLSRKPTPHIMWYWHASRLKQAKFAYLCTSSLAQGVLEELNSLFRLAPADEKNLSRVQTMVLVRREVGHDKLLVDLPAKKAQVHALLQQQHPVMPKVSESNFYDICFTMKRCLLFFQQVTIPQVSNLQLGWILPREQSEFVAFFKDRDRTPTAVLLDTEKHRYASFLGTPEHNTILEWLSEPTFRDASQMPFLNPEPVSMGNFLLEFLDSDFVSPSSMLLVICIMLGTLLVMFRFL